MSGNINTFEENLRKSFSYVKKDLLSINENISDIMTKIQHLSMNNAALLQEVSELKNIISEKGKKTSKKK